MTLLLYYSYSRGWNEEVARNREGVYLFFIFNRIAFECKV